MLRHLVAWEWGVLGIFWFDSGDGGWRSYFGQFGILKAQFFWTATDVIWIWIADNQCFDTKAGEEVVRCFVCWNWRMDICGFARTWIHDVRISLASFVPALNTYSSFFLSDKYETVSIGEVIKVPTKIHHSYVPFSQALTHNWSKVTPRALKKTSPGIWSILSQSLGFVISALHRGLILSAFDNSPFPN